MRVFFKNGYGLSIVRNDQFCSYRDDLYEIALLQGNKKSWSLVHDCVYRNLTDDQVTEAIAMVQKSGMPKYE